MSSGQPPSRLRRFFWIALTAFVLFSLFGFFLLPPIVRAQMEQRLSAALGRVVRVGHVSINPYALSVTIDDFDVSTKERTGSFAGWKHLYVNFEAVRSIFGEWVFDTIELDGAHGAVKVGRDGSLNFDDIVKHLQDAAPPPPPGTVKAMRPVRIGSLRVTDARLEFTDESRPTPFATVVGPVAFTLTEFRTNPGPGAPYRFEAVTEAGEKFSWRGMIGMEPLRSSGELSIENVILSKYAPYYSDRIKATIADGKLSLRGRYEAVLGSQTVMKLADGALQLRNFKLVGATGGDPVVELPALDVAGVNADALARKANIASVALQGGHLRVRREADGSINLLGLIPAAHAAAPAAAVPLPDFLLGEFAVKDFQVDVTDLAAPRPAQLGLTGIQFSAKDVTLADGAAIPLNLSLGWAPQGAVRVEGSVTLRPELKATFKTEVTALGILPLSPYLEEFVNARITQGAVSSTGNVQIAMDGAVPAITYEGEARVEKFGLVDAAHNEDLAGFTSLTFTGLKATTGPQLGVTLAEVSVAAPYARVLIDKDQKINLAGLAKAAPTVAPLELPPGAKVVGAAAGGADAASAPKTPAPSGPKVEIARVVITDGDFTAEDRSVEPNVHLALNHFGGTLAELSSTNPAKATVDLKGAVDGAGPLSIVGTFDALGAAKSADLAIECRGIDLLPMSPYSGKYAGYELARGKLATDVKFKLNGAQLDSTNVVTLNQFTFGAPTNSPDAIHLPVRLGVALLKDLDGKIVIDIPVQGSVDDPNFRIGKVVWRVIDNLLVKVATSPFSLLGSMFGGGGEDLSFQEFAPGEATLQPAGRPKLDTMVKALTNRPALSLALEGGYDGPADTYALKHEKLRQLVRRRIWEERHAADPNVAPPEQLEITPEANAAMVKKIYDEKFPPGTEFGAPVTKAPEVAPPPRAAEPRKGFFRKAMDVVTFKKLRGKEDRPEAPPKPEPPPPAAPEAATAGPSLEEMTGRLADTMTVSDDDLRALAAARAQAVRDFFLNEGKIAGDRLFLAQGGADAAKAGKGPRVFLTLQ